MAFQHNEYLVIEHKTLNSDYDDKSTRLPEAEAKAARLAAKRKKVMVIVKVLEIITPEETAVF